MKILGVLLIAVAVGLLGAVVSLLPAQLACFGLSYYGIHTGLFANWLLVVAAEGIISGAVVSTTTGKD